MNKKNLPHHIAIIMDGNRRWAKEHGLLILLGHKKAADEAIEPIIEKAAEIGIKYLTFWAFSTENWQRDREEIKGLMNIFRHTLKEKFANLVKNRVKIKILGDLSRFPPDIQEEVKKLVETTKNNQRITVCFALNYGGRDEIIRAINKWCSKKRGPALREKLTEDDFGQYLDTAELPDPDLIIRTGGEMRLSGFLPWQAVYSELYFTELYFPDFTPLELEKAVAEYKKRERRFGK